MGLIGDVRIDDGKVLRVPRCDPVYRTGNKEYLAPVESYLKSINGLTVIGRYGAFNRTIRSQHPHGTACSGEHRQ